MENFKNTKFNYFKSIKLAQCRTFSETQKLSFVSKDGSPCMWNLIIGDNGTGKTTILRSLALALSVNQEYVYEYWGERNEVVPSLFVREENKKAQFDYVLLGEKDAELPFTFTSDKYGISQKKEGAVRAIYMGDFPFYNLPKLVAYGANRKIGDSKLSSEKSSPVISLFNENALLSNAEEWLLQADYKSKTIKGNRNIVKIEEILLDLFKGEISDIKIMHDPSSNRMVSNVFFKTDYGMVRLHQLSLGYKTILAWMVDFSMQLFNFYPESKNPLREPAVCLVDEIDLHLHPKFQRNLVAFLSKTFPKTQFIATAHSPLIVQAFSDANIIMLKKEKDHVVADINPLNIKAYRIDQILTSDLFGLKSGHSVNAEKLLKKRTNILSKESLTIQDEKELERIEKELGKIPTWEDKYERQAMSAIDKIALWLENKEIDDKNKQKH